MSKYFFRDLDHRDNLENGIEWNPCGAVIADNGDNPAGKDLVVLFYNSFTDQVVRQYRERSEVALIEVDGYTYNEFVSRLENMK